VTDLAEAGLPPGSWSRFLGPNVPSDDLAERARTNAYEVMTALGRRYARIYVDGPHLSRRPAPETARDLPIVTALGQMSSLCWRPSPRSPSLATQSLRQMSSRLITAADRPQLLDDRLLLAAGGRPDRDLHRHGAGAAELYRLWPASRRKRHSNVVVVSLTRELGPVLAGLMVAGRRCRDGGRDRHHARHRADRCADDAVDHPFKYLVAPR